MATRESTTEKLIQVDRALIESVETELIQMMENADRNLAHMAVVTPIESKMWM